MEHWPLHLRHFTATGDDYDVPEEDMGAFLLLTLRGGAVHFFIEVVDGLKGGKRNWNRT